MTTTIDIPDETLIEIMRFTKAKTEGEAIVTALEDFSRRRRMAELVKYSGTCQEMMSSEELMELRERELPPEARLYSK